MYVFLGLNPIWSKYFTREEDLALGGGHAMQYTDGIS